MTAYRAWTSLVGVLCLTGTAMAQSSYLGASDPYGVRMTRWTIRPRYAARCFVMRRRPLATDR